MARRAIVALALIVTVVGAHRAAAYSSSTWYQGADGWAQARRQQRATGALIFVYFRAEWCPHCRRQNEMFGSALRYIHSVDCTNGCSDVKSFPMWTFRDGSRHPGVASFDVLARKTQCAFGQSDGDDGGWRRPERQAPRDDDDQREASEYGTSERMIGGAKIIEVPRR